MASRWVTIPVLAVAVACSGGGKSNPDEPVVDTRPPKRATLTWGMSAATPKDGVPRTEVFLAITEETGKAVSYPVGTYDGTCGVVGPIEAYHALTAISCTLDGAGVQLHAASNPGEIVVLKMILTPGREPDPFSRDTVTTIPVPIGAKVEAGAQ